MICPTCGYDNLAGADDCEDCQGSLTQEDVPQAGAQAGRSIVTEPLSALRPPVPASVHPKAAVAEAIETMRRMNTGYVLVIDDSRDLVGIFTERDVLFKVVGKIQDTGGIPVAELMSTRPTALKVTDPIQQALYLMAHNGYRHIPLLDENGKPTGVSSVRAILSCLGQVR